MHAASDILGPIFNITKVHREHMGVYVCGKIECTFPLFAERVIKL